MSENKKYYYMKLKENFFTSERMVVLETMPDGILYSNLLLKMYLMSLKHNGILLLHENLPHTPQTIATFTRHQILHRSGAKTPGTAAFTSAEAPV